MPSCFLCYPNRFLCRNRRTGRKQGTHSVCTYRRGTWVHHSLNAALAWRGKPGCRTEPERNENDYF